MIVPVTCWLYARSPSIYIPILCWSYVTASCKFEVFFEDKSNEFFKISAKKKIIDQLFWTFNWNRPNIIKLMTLLSHLVPFPISKWTPWDMRDPSQASARCFVTGTNLKCTSIIILTIQKITIAGIIIGQRVNSGVRIIPSSQIGFECQKKLYTVNMISKLTMLSIHVEISVSTNSRLDVFAYRRQRTCACRQQALTKNTSLT